MPRSESSTRSRAYVDAAINGILADLRAAPVGGRNAALNTASFSLGRLVGAGAVTSENASGLLHEGARLTGLAPDEARSTIRSGLRAGMRSPRALPVDVALDTPRRAPEPPPEKPLPDREQVAALWHVCVDVRDDAEVCRYLTGRGLDVHAIADLDLARALPVDTPLPGFARGPFGTWTETGHRVVLPLHDAHGELRALLARNVLGASPKALGGRRGLVMADAGARTLLQGANDLGGARVHVILAEGDADFLALATGPASAEQWTDNADRPCVIGIGSGSWSGEHAARVPDGALLEIATHTDAAGEGYASKVVATFDARERVELTRRSWR